MLTNNFQVSFFCKEIPGLLETEFLEAGFVIVTIENEQQFLDELTTDVIVVIDGYGFDTAYQRRIKGKGCKLVCIDDLHDQEFFADLIINHSPGIIIQDYTAQPYTQFALGLDYALLRPVFHEQAGKERIINKIENVMICFGGSDPGNLTQSVLQIVSGFQNFTKIIAVTGQAYHITESFIQLIANDDRIENRHALGEQQMLETMLEAELAIVPSSGILFEALSAKCVVLTAPVIENQQDIFKGFNGLNCVIGINDFSDECLVSRLRNLLSNPLPVLANPLSGEIIQNFQKIFNRLLLKLRKATMEDAELLFNWANDLTVRRNSFNITPIIWNNHIAWLEEKLTSKESILLILTAGSDSIGQIRFDSGPDGFWYIDYSIADKFRGKGYGKHIVELSLEQVKKEIKNVKAEVKAGNIASCKVFEALGFKNSGKNDETNSHIEFVRIFD
jgi:spore coat polysaccharide biosynthesis predicted glycosyltransferase SpsG/RimJ/RimL family protein N-acetyltransferase